MSRFLLLALICTGCAVAADPLTVVSTATYAAPVASESIASAFARDLATGTLSANSVPLPTSLGGTTVSVQDSASVSRPAAIFFVSPGQVNFQIPPQTAAGFATVTTSSGDGNVSIGSVEVVPVAPGLFSAVIVSDPPAILELFGTGIRGNSGLSAVTCLIGGAAAQVQYAGPQGDVGLDQVNVAIPANLAGLGALNVVLIVNGQTSNTVTIDIGGTVAPAVTFYVAPNGNDAWSGTLAAPNAAGTDGPFATLTKAQQAVRGHGNHVVLRAGTYTLTRPLNFTAADSSVTWSNYPGETPVISGGKPITGWTASPTIPGGWQASVAGFEPFEQLWVNGARRYRVSVPVSGSSAYFHNLGPVYVTAANGCTNPAVKQGFTPSVLISPGKYECFDRFYFNTGDINPAWSGLSNPLHPIEIIDFEDWTIARLRLVSIGSTAGMSGAPANSSIALLAGPTATGTFWGFLKGHRYLVDNVQEFLTSTAAGEWYVATDNAGNPSTITYIPAAGENFSTNPPVVIAPQVNQLVVTNDPGLNNLTFEGLTFSFSNWVAGSPGYAGYDGSQNSGNEYVPAALSFTNAGSITLNSVTLAHLGGWGIEFVGVSNLGSGNQVVNSVITDLGAGGIRVGAAPVKTDTDANVTQYTQIYNNVLSSGDRMVPGVAITIENSHHNIMDHNEIYDFYNQGINLGRALNFNANGLPNWVHDNQITYNHIYNLGQGVTCDIGAVHTATGLQTGNTIEYNRFHDISHNPGDDGYGGWGIYLDQGSSFVTVMDNLVYNTLATGFTYNASQQGTYQLNGTPNPVTNNIFAFGWQSSIHRNNLDGALNFTFANNIVYWDQTNPMAGQTAPFQPSPQDGTWNCATAPTICFAFAQNLYYSTVDPNMNTWRFQSAGKFLTFPQWQTLLGEDKGSSVNVDPLFTNPAQFDFSLQAGSPARKLINFQPFDANLAGRVGAPIPTPPVPPGFPLQLPASY